MKDVTGAPRTVKKDTIAPVEEQRPVVQADDEVKVRDALAQVTPGSDGVGLDGANKAFADRGGTADKRDVNSSPTLVRHQEFVSVGGRVPAGTAHENWEGRGAFLSRIRDRIVSGLVDGSAKPLDGEPKMERFHRIIASFQDNATTFGYYSISAATQDKLYVAQVPHDGSPVRWLELGR